MKPTTSSEIRQAFLDFFAEVGHEVVGSSPLPVYDNPTLLFTNAGMNQFVNVFLGSDQRPYRRAASSQKCMRIQGKHNDLENVGPSPRHHTFFEMLGNFSFGDYFKREAIAYAWTFLTQVIGLDKERLWVSIYTEDDEANALWLNHVPQERILRFGKSENFWEMGETGPCGPCSEIHYYSGPLEEMRPEGVNVDDAYLEVWNLVFMQYDKDETGALTPLPRPSIDTGMGLERVVQVVQGFDNNYDTDLFRPVLDHLQQALGDSDEERAEHLVGYRVIADHGRAATFLIGDGVLPGNVGGGYVLRMIIRRAARYGRKIGFDAPFLADVARVFIEMMGPAYPDLRLRAEHILHTLTLEERRFARTLDSAMTRLDVLLDELHQQGETELDGETAFNLYATHGLPVEITRDVAVERGFTVDEPGFRAARAAHAAASGTGAFDAYETGASVYGDVFRRLLDSGRLTPAGVDIDPYSDPVGEAEIIAILRDGAAVDEARAGDIVELVTGATPFYVESGGEVSDTGRFVADDGLATARIDDVRRPAAAPGLILHVGEVIDGILQVGQFVRLEVDDRRRMDIRRNHTATHILHAELRAILGTHVTQQGSLVAPDRLRFDFSHGAAVDSATLGRIEEAINDAVLANYPTTIRYMDRERAVGAGAMALFGEKYGDVVRTVTLGDADQPYSFELCGGLHVAESGEIGFFKFTTETAVAAGVRRVEAVTGRGAYAYAAARLNALERVTATLNVPVAEVEERLAGLLAENRALQKEVETARRTTLLMKQDVLFAQVRDVDGVRLLAAIVDGADADGLRLLIDHFRDREPRGVAVLGTVNDGRPLLIAGVSQALVDEGVHAGNIIREIARIVGGGGGGRPQLAQAGGRDPRKLQEALTAVEQLVRQARR